jgi:hypothetical protein
MAVPPTMRPAATSPEEVALKSCFKQSTKATHKELGRISPRMDAMFLIFLSNACPHFRRGTCRKVQGVVVHLLSRREPAQQLFRNDFMSSPIGVVAPR